MSGHDELRDLLAPVTLGAATPEEAARVHAHLPACPACRAEYEDLQAASDALALTPPPADPPAALRRRVLAAVRAEAPAAPAHAARPGRRLGWPALAAALGAACLGLLAWNISLARTPAGAEPVRQVAVRGGPAAPAVRGEVVWVPARGAAVVRLEGLPDPGPGRGWRLWAIRDGRPESLGQVTAVGRGGAASAGVAGLAGVQALALTPERPAHPGGPTSTPAVQVALPA
ncbi:MAG: anti-sigma factor [Acidimicrobiia bacterium]|nr:anti-sigma factor [Acidimicrobiia bacterium]